MQRRNNVRQVPVESEKETGEKVASLRTWSSRNKKGKTHQCVVYKYISIFLVSFMWFMAVHGYHMEIKPKLVLEDFKYSQEALFRILGPLLFRISRGKVFYAAMHNWQVN